MIIQSVSDPRGFRWFLLKGRHNSSCKFKAVVLPENEWAFKMRQIIRPEGWNFSFCWIEMTQIETRLVYIWDVQSYFVLHWNCQGVCEAAVAMVTMLYGRPPHWSGVVATRLLEEDHKESFIQLGRIQDESHKSFFGEEVCWLVCLWKWSP